MMEAATQKPMITVAEFLESSVKPLLQSDQWIAAGRGSTVLFSLVTQKILRHGRHDRPRERVRNQHRKHDRFGEGDEEVTRHTGKQEHRCEDNTYRERGNECWRRYLRCTVKDNFVHILIRLRLSITVDVLDFHGCVIHQDSHRQSQAA